MKQGQYRAIPYPIKAAVSDYAGAGTSDRAGTLNRNDSDYRTCEGLISVTRGLCGFRRGSGRRN